MIKLYLSGIILVVLHCILELDRIPLVLSSVTTSFYLDEWIVFQTQKSWSLNFDIHTNKSNTFSFVLYRLRNQSRGKNKNVIDVATFSHKPMLYITLVICILDQEANYYTKINGIPEKLMQTCWPYKPYCYYLHANMVCTYLGVPLESKKMYFAVNNMYNLVLLTIPF